MDEILFSVGIFTGLVMLLVTAVLLARRFLAPGGGIQLTINDRPPIEVPAGWKLSVALATAGIHLPAGCGGRGTCGLCRVVVPEGGGPVLPIEEGHFRRSELRMGARLACQIVLREDCHVVVPDDVLDVHRFEATVREARWMTPFIREIVLALPEDEAFSFRAGAFVQVTCPPYCVRYRDLDIPPAYREVWDRLDLLRLVARTHAPATRAYSLANPPAEARVLRLDVRLAIPPPGSDAEVPPGVVSSFLCAMQPGDVVEVSGPYGHFFVPDSDRELVFVGGGAGMAPMRAHVLDQLEGRKSTRRVSLWYGARALRDLFYADEFDRLDAAHPNFEWHVALSEPRAEDDWAGATGFIHAHLHDHYLANHPAPEACEYYLCGPPLMVRAVTDMLLGLGVDPDDIHADDFGGG